MITDYIKQFDNLYIPELNNPNIDQEINNFLIDNYSKTIFSDIEFMLNSYTTKFKMTFKIVDKTIYVNDLFINYINRTYSSVEKNDYGSLYIVNDFPKIDGLVHRITDFYTDYQIKSYYDKSEQIPYGYYSMTKNYILLSYQTAFQILTKEEYHNFVKSRQNINKKMDLKILTNG